MRRAFEAWSEGLNLAEAGRYAKAEECARRALALMPASGKGRDLLLLRCLDLLGLALRQQGRYREAEEPLVRAIGIAERLTDARPGVAAGAWNSFGVLCKFAGWFERGEDAYARALALAAGEPMTTATILHNIGGLAHARGRFAEAEEPSRRAWEMRRELLGEDDPATLADAVAYAAVLDGLKRYGESRPVYEKALAIYESRFGPEHYEVAAALHNLALLDRSEGLMEEARLRSRRAYEIKKRVLGERHVDTALSAMALASTLADGPDRNALLAEALVTFKASLDPGHPHIGQCRALSAMHSVSWE